MSFTLQEIRSYKIAQRLREIAQRHPDDEATLTDAAELLERGSRDLLKLNRSVTSNALEGKMTIGCIRLEDQLLIRHGRR